MVKDAEAIAETHAALRRWNDLHPNHAISGMRLAASVRARNRRIGEAEQGVYLSRKHTDARSRPVCRG